MIKAPFRFDPIPFTPVPQGEQGLPMFALLGRKYIQIGALRTFAQDYIRDGHWQRRYFACWMWAA